MSTKKVVKKTKQVEEENIGISDIDDVIKHKLQAVKRRSALEDFAYRLTSRKFWLTFGVCLYFAWRGLAAAQGSFDAEGRSVADIAALSAAFSSLTQVIIAFLAIQGGTDALAKFAEARETGQRSQDYGTKEELDSSVVNAAQNVRIATQIENISEEPLPPVPPGG